MEEEILKAIYEADRISNKPWSHEQSAKVSAEIAKRHIMEALDEAYDEIRDYGLHSVQYEKWKVEYLKSKGIE
jgi:hypothetical protein